MDKSGRIRRVIFGPFYHLRREAAIMTENSSSAPPPPRDPVLGRTLVPDVYSALGQRHTHIHTDVHTAAARVLRDHK